MKKTLIAFLLAGSAALPALAGSLPRFESFGEEPLTDNDRNALVRWVFEQPEVLAHFEGGRVRALRAGAMVVKDDEGREIRQGLVHVRNYKLGVAHSISVDLLTGEIGITDDRGSVQPNDEEFEEAVAVVRDDAEFGALMRGNTLHVTGGFYERSPIAEDICSKNVCLLVELMNPGHGNGWARRVVVDLTRRKIANRNFVGPTSLNQIVPLADMGGKQ